MHTSSELLRLSLLQTDTDSVDSTDDESDSSSVTQEEGEFTAVSLLIQKCLQEQPSISLQSCFSGFALKQNVRFVFLKELR